MTRYDFLKKAQEKHGFKYIYPTLPYKVLSTDTIDILYKDVLYTQKVSKHLMGRSPEKNTPKKTTEEFIKEAKEIWGEKYDYSLTEYKGALKKIKVIYDGIIFEQIAASHLKYGPEGNMNKEYFLKKSKEIYKDKYDYSLVEYVNCTTKVKIKHNDEIYEQTPKSHLKHCPENISLSTRKTTETFIEESNLVHDFKYNYEKTEYIRNNLKVIITCPIHGDFEQTPISHITNKSGCKKCKDSIGEKKISKILNKYNIHYSREHGFEDCKNIYPLRFDFYIPSMRICIEFDGIQHFEPVEIFGGEESFRKLKQNDLIKNEYCEDNYIDLIRIKYDQVDNIENILYNSLKYHIKRLGLKQKNPL